MVRLIDTSAHRRVLSERISEFRRQIAAVSLREFTRLYLGHYCESAFSPMHEELFGLLESSVDGDASRLAIAAPRGHAKSTIASLALPLWLMLYGHKEFILIVSATKPQATDLLRHIREELAGNELIARDFPHLARREHGVGTGLQPKPWRSNRLTLPGGGVIAAYGSHQSLRGVRAGNRRPDLIICDDLEELEQAVSEEQRDKLRAWFSGTLIPAGTPQTDVVVVGTILHHDALLARLTDPDRGVGWESRVYRAMIREADDVKAWKKWRDVYLRDDSVLLKSSGERITGPKAAARLFKAHRKRMLEGAEVLWPQRESYHDLMVMREREGRHAFQAEKQNQPLDPQQCVFAETDIRFWDDEFPNETALLASLHNPKFMLGCDPSIGKPDGDYSAIIVLVRCMGDNRRYVLAADIERRSPDEILSRIAEYHRMYGLSRIGIETNQFQQLLVKPLKEKLRETGRGTVFIEEISNSAQKHARITSIEPYLAQHRLMLSRRHKLLLEQLRSFPLARHDDGPDALELALRAADKGGGMQMMNI